MKPFRAHLAEQDSDYEYKLCSVENIHNTEIVAKIRLALGRYGLLALEPQGVQIKMNDNQANSFVQYPFMPVYVTTVILSSPLSSRNAVQSIALFTKIKDDRMAFFDKDEQIVMDGAENEQHAHPVEVDSASSQAEVGDAHVASLMTDLMKDLTAHREANTITRDVYEGYVCSHLEVAKATGQKVRRGFYVIENAKRGVPTMVGPHKKIPMNYAYSTRLPQMDLVEEIASNNGLTEFQVSFHQEDQQGDPKEGGSRLRGTNYEVTVVDQDTGKEHTISTRATSIADARSQGVELISAKLGIAKERLIPTKPEAEPAN